MLRTKPHRVHPWVHSLVILVVVAGGILLSDRLLRPYDPMQNILLIAFVAGTIAAGAIVRPLGQVPYLIRNLDAGADLDAFLASAIVSWLGVRFALGLNGYPRVQGNGLHIAHMLWGGVLMLAGIVILILYLGRYRQRMAALVSGIGFGLFIDELGKFITSNNDYFFRPAVALVYAIFVALYLLFRALRQPRHLSDREYLVNSLDWLKEAIIRDHDPRALQRARYYAAQLRTKGADGRALEDLLDCILVTLKPSPGRLERLRRKLVANYHRTIQNPRFERIAIGVVLLLVGVQIFTDIEEIRSFLNPDVGSRLSDTHRTLTFYNAAGTIIEGAAGVIGDILLLAGAATILRSRPTAFRLWRLGILIIMFVAGGVSLYYYQFLALPELIVDMAGLAIVNGLQEAEREAMNASRTERPARSLDSWAGHSLSAR